ncbi:MAG: hypothetical protein SPI94_04805 [Candidatus Onthovivens sp.]|nr:hypothetical protein [Clostridium sp.]MDY5984772.1 hypothetical protein [Candidatus Onthovivens sp.]
MLIISQDKMEVYNFDEIFRLYVDNWSNEEFATEPNCFCIKAEKSSDNMICAFLGEYKTEERAKEVLQEIIKAYKETNYEYENCWCLRNVIYEMPAD